MRHDVRNFEFQYQQKDSLVSSAWQVLDKSSMAQARLCKPALVFVKLLNEVKEDHWLGYNCDIDPAINVGLTVYVFGKTTIGTADIPAKGSGLCSTGVVVTKRPDSSLFHSF